MSALPAAGAASATGPAAANSGVRRRAAYWARKTHKWIAWLVGIQAVLWMVSGLYMTAISIDTIHGDHLVQLDEAPLGLPSDMDIDALLSRYPDTTGYRLKRWMGRPVVELRRGQEITLLDVDTGRALGPIDEATARKLATSLYIGNAPIRNVQWLTVAPAEVSTRPVPLWRVEFADTKETTLYLSPITGELLAKRHDLWRWFDVLWMLHIMDYDDRSDIDTPLLRIASTLGLVFGLSGTWLLFYSFRRRRKP